MLFASLPPISSRLGEQIRERKFILRIWKNFREGAAVVDVYTYDIPLTVTACKPRLRLGRVRDFVRVDSPPHPRLTPQ